MPTYRIEYSSETVAQLGALRARDAAAALDGVLRHLSDQPTVETRNRKRMRPNPLAPWELRLGRLRVYYDVLSEPEPIVLIRAIGIKERNTVVIGKKSLRL